MAFWDSRVKSLSKSFLSNKQNFLANPDVSKVMQTHNIKSINNLISFLNDADLINRIKDPLFGKPSTHKGVSLQSVRNAAYRKIMNEFFDLSSIHHVTDFGGGFGNNCRIWYTLGYQGDFCLIDLQQVLDIQRHYLSNVLPDISVSYLTSIDQLQINKSKSLFFATYSISETSLEIREQAIPFIKNHDFIFIAHNNSFPVYGKNLKVDNEEYFSKFKQQLSDQFDFFDFNHRIYKSNSSYVIGKKK